MTGSDWIRRPLPLLLVPVLACAAYLNGVNLQRNFSHEEVMRYIHPLHFHRTGPVALWLMTETAADRNMRPLVTVSWWLNSLAAGDDPFGYYTVNLGLHLTAIALLAALARSLTGSPGIALVTALLFASHPVAASVTGRLACRHEMLCAVWYLAALLAGLRAVRGRGSVGWAMLAAILAVFSKEMALTLPIAFWGMRWLPITEYPDGRHRKSRLLAIGAGLVCAVALAIRLIAYRGLGGYGNHAEFSWERGGVSMLTHLMRTAVLDVRTAWQLLAVAASLLLLPAAMRSVWGRAGLAFTLVSLLPVANIQAPWYEYLPAMGWSLALAAGLAHSARMGASRRRIASLCLVAALVCAWGRESWWRNRLTTPGNDEFSQLDRQITAHGIQPGTAIILSGGNPDPARHFRLDATERYLQVRYDDPDLVFVRLPPASRLEAVRPEAVRDPAHTLWLRYTRGEILPGGP